MACLGLGLCGSQAQAQDWVEPEVSAFYGEYLLLTWPSGYNVSIENETTVGYVTEESTGKVYECEYYNWGLMAESRYIYFEIGSVTADETYRIQLAAADYLMTYNGESIETKDIDITWTYVVAPKEPEYVVYETKYADNAAVFYVSNGYTTIVDGSEAIITHNGEEIGTVTLYEDTNNIIDWDYFAYVISVPVPEELLTENGTYSVIVPSTAYTAQGLDYDTYNYYDIITIDMECEFTVTTSALNSIQAEAQSFTVYTTSGVCVLRDANADQVKALPKGLYIVNGKKVAITK